MSLTIPTDNVGSVALELLRELDSRTNDGLTVTLLYGSGAWILVQDMRGSDSLFPVAGDHAADAFAHPYRYMP